MARKLRILAQSDTAAAGRVYVARVVMALALMALGGVAAFGLAPDTTLDTVPSERIVRDLALPPMSPPEAEESYWREEQIRRGDTLGSVLARLGVDDAAAQSFLRADSGARSLYQLRPGRSLRALTDGDGRLMALRSLASSGELLAVDRAADRDGVQFVARTAIPDAATGLTICAAGIASPSSTKHGGSRATSPARGRSSLRSLSTRVLPIVRSCGAAPTVPRTTTVTMVEARERRSCAHPWPSRA